MSNINQQQQSKTSAYFVRKNVNEAPKSNETQKVTLNIPGTRTSIQNSQLLTAIGVPSIDTLIGGGLPVGSLCLIGQDKNNSFSDIIMRCFIGEGVLHNHALYVACLNESKDSLFNRIPNVNKLELDQENKTTMAQTNENKLRIAWRYGQQQPLPSDEAAGQGLAKTLQPNYFYMNKFMSSDDVYAASNVKMFDVNLGDNNSCDTLYKNLANDIENHINQLNMNITKTKSYTNILRIVINSAGGLIWNDKCTQNENNSTDLCRFLLNLRSILRHSLAVCILTLPNEVVDNQELVDKFTHLSDFAFLMDDSTKATNGLTTTNYSGLFKLIKIPCLNSLMPCCTPETLDLAFYIKHKRLVVEQLNLPPDISENDDTKKGRTNTAVSVSCSSGGSGKLDF